MNRFCLQIPERNRHPRSSCWLCTGIGGVSGGSSPADGGQSAFPRDSSSEECTVLEAPPTKNTCPQHAGKVAHLFCPACEEACVRTVSQATRSTPRCSGPGPGAAAWPPAGEAHVCAEQTAPGLRCPEPHQRTPPAADQSESFHRRGRPFQLRGSAQAAGRPEECPAHGAGGHIRTQTEGPPGPGRPPGPGGGGHGVLLYPVRGGPGGGGVCGQHAGGGELQEQLLHLAQLNVSCQPEENDQLDLMMETDTLRKSIHNLGTIVTTSAVASQSEAMGAGLEECRVGHPASVTVVTRDKSGGACKSGNAVLSAEVFTPDGSIVDGEIVDHKNGTYEFVYVIPKEGDFSLALRLYDQHIKGSPFKLSVSRSSEVEVSPSATTTTNSAAYATPSTGSSDGAKRRGKSPGQKKKGSKRASSALGTPRRKTQNPIEDDLIFKIGTKGRNKGEFTNLQGVAASSCGRVLIADSNNQCVQIFSNDGEFKTRFGVRGRSPGQLQRPTGVAVHPSGDIILADYDNKWVSIFSCEGKFKAKLGSGRLLGPKGVSVDQNGHVIVVDNKACTVFIFQLSGKLITKFGSRGNGDKQFAGPHFAAVNKNNEIIVTDFHNHSVKVFTPEGDLLLKFGSNGEGNGQFNAPTGVAVDVNGNIIVADWGNSRIQVFDGSGSFLSYINTSADPLYGPQGLALTSDGHVVVADSGNHCFKVYRYLQ
ncbi:tripartite motif-containing protein 2-like isoform X2 [Takifugu flavidus]|uniref:tripartite motif-containing protein 2-like isoform X2 n=1 Tax=Takifugu flavidus TaxID=433684 RepID=UPI002544BF15|nr:tripartite motif-containing protein 2-like isoform X2 [Takifugu flavidus]